MSLWMTDTHTHSVSYKSSSQPTFVHHLPPTYICSHSIVHACFQLFNFSLYCEHYWEELCGWVSQKHRMSHPGKPCICSSPASSLHLDPPHPSHPFPNVTVFLSFLNCPTGSIEPSKCETASWLWERLLGEIFHSVCSFLPFWECWLSINTRTYLHSLHLLFPVLWVH